MNTENTIKQLPPPGGHDPAAELKIAKDIIEGGGGGQSVAVAPGVVKEAVLGGPDTAFLPRDVIHGVRFDPERHLTHPNGQPVLGSRKQLKLKKEFKKSAGKKVVDAVKEKFGYVGEEDAAEIPVVEEIHEEPLLFDDIPPSDDELYEIHEDQEEIPAPPTPKEERRARKSAEQTANFILDASTVVAGGEIRRQRKSEEFTDLVDACEKWNEDTGHSFDLPPNIAFVFAAIGAVSAMARNEPNCAIRMDNTSRVVRKNVTGLVREKLPFLKVVLGCDTPVSNVDEFPAGDEIQVADEAEAE